MLPLAFAGATAADEPLAVTSPLIVRQALLTRESFPGPQWVFYPGRQDARLEETWSLRPEPDGPVLVCRGEPHGYLRTATVYRDFEFGLEWRFPADANGNSGVLMFTNGEDRIWPTAVQVQLHQPNTGSVFGSGGMQVQPELESHNLSKPVNQWNTLVITSRQGSVWLNVNGKDLGEVRVVGPAMGAIGLQSEGSEVHFRHIWIRDLQPIAQAADLGDTMSCCDPRCCPVNGGGTPFAPAFGVNPTYLGSWGLNCPVAPPLTTPTYTYGTPYVAYGNALAGRRRQPVGGRGLALAGAPAWEWEDGVGRRGVRLTRGSRSRR